MRLALAAAVVLFNFAAQAQTPLTGTTGPLASDPPRTSTPPSSAAISPGTAQTAPASRRHAHRTLQERFDEANTTHDGHLTAEQARAKMPSVARDFAAIDTGSKGYVTLDEIRAHARNQRAARRAARTTQQ